jgi:hypothetical protein
MERVSAKHGPRLDDELARETESLTRGAPIEARAEEWRMAEPPGDGEPLPDARLSGEPTGETALILTLDETEARAALASALRPTAFPGDAPSLRRVALENDAEQWVLDLLTRVDQVERYETVGELWRAAGGHVDAGNGRATEHVDEIREEPRRAPARPAEVRSKSRSSRSSRSSPARSVSQPAGDGATSPSRKPLDVAVSAAIGVGILVARTTCNAVRGVVRTVLRR